MNEDKIIEYLASIQQSVAGIQEDVAELKEDVSELKEDVSDLKQRVTQLEADSQFIKGVVSKIEVEHGKKLGALFDGFFINRDIVTTYDDRLRKVERDTETHSIELRYLKAGIG